MAKPLNDPVMEAVTTTGASDSRHSRGHRTHSLFVSATTVSGTIEVRLEASPNGDDWATVSTLDGDVILTDADFNSNNNGMNATGGCALEYLRARVVQNTANDELDVWLMSSSHGGPAQRGRAAGDP